MSALAALGSLTVVSTQSSLKTSTNDRAQAIALYAAESGAAVAMDFLRRSFTNASAGSGWTAYVRPANTSVQPVPASDIPSNNALPGTSGNLFSPDQNAWFTIELLNNRDDDGFTAGTDTDGKLVIRTTGHGPQGSLAIVEWEVQRISYWLEQLLPSPPPPFSLPAGNPPAFPWPVDPPVTAPPSTAGMVLLGWHIVSL